LIELVGDPSMVVGNYGLYKNPSETEFDTIAEALIKAAQHRESLAKFVHTRATERFDIKSIGQSYANVLGV